MARASAPAARAHRPSQSALPRPGLQKRDRYALRFVALLLVVGGFVWAGSDAGKRLALAFTPDSGTGASAASLDAWINPPAYTGEAPIYLQHPVDGDTVAVPVGSELVLRVHAAHGLPNLALEPEPDDRVGKFAGLVRRIRHKRHHRARPLRARAGRRQTARAFPDQSHRPTIRRISPSPSRR